MKKLNPVFISVALALTQSCFADTTSMPTPSPGGPQQRMQTLQSMTPAQRQAAMEAKRVTLQSRMSGMRAMMQSRMGGNTTGPSSTGGALQ